MADEEYEHSEESTPADSSIPPEQEERIVDKVVDKIKGFVSDIAGPGREAGEGEPPSAPAAPPGPAATEADMEQRVKNAVESEITSKERRSAAAEARRAHDEEHERIRGLVEKPPKTYSRLTSALWGGDDS